MTVSTSFLRYSNTHPWAGRALDKFGHALSKTTFGHYRVGLSRLAERMAAELEQHKSLELRDGYVAGPQGQILIEDPLLKVGKDFGKLPENEFNLSYPEMVKLLRSVYLKPKTWGDTKSYISVQSGLKHWEGIIHEEINYLNDKLGIGNNPGAGRFRMEIVPLNWKYNLISPQKDSKKTRGAFWSTSLMAASNIGIRPKLTELQFRMAFAHEYVHYLKHAGFIKNDSVAEGVAHIRGQEINSHEINDLDFLHGMAIALVRFLQKDFKSHYISEHDDKNGSYAMGKWLGGVAVSLTQDRDDPDLQWRFIKIAAQTTTKADLIRSLRQDRILKTCLPAKLAA